MNKRIILVLGMHRSGTSALTKGLEVLGVSLGNELYSAIAGNNDKGFFEDIETNKLNNEILDFIGMQWDSLTKISKEALLERAFPKFKDRAKSLIREKLKKNPIFGLKDPRFCRLLPFWQKIFQSEGIETSYIISIRNPLNIASSLSKRDDMDIEKSCYLWLSHLAAAVHNTEDKNRVFVSYDALLENPESQLSRVATKLSLPSPSAEMLSKYHDSFLDNELRRSTLGMKDLEESIQAPPIVKSAYYHLLCAAEGQPDSAEESLRKVISESLRILDELNPSFILLDRKLTALKQSKDSLQVVLSTVESLKQQLSESANIISEQSHETLRLSESIKMITDQLSSSQKQLEETHNELAQEKELSAQERDRAEKLIEELGLQECQRVEMLIENLSTQECKRIEDLIENLCAQERNRVEELIERLGAQERGRVEELIEQLKTCSAEKAQHASHIEHLHLEHEILKHKLQDIYSSSSWRITSPIRVLKNLAQADSNARREYLLELLRAIWRKLPLSPRNKARIRAMLLESRASQAAPKDLFPSEEVVHEGVPRIIFDDARDEFIPFKENPAINPLVKLIAFYLPQFHPFPENDRWWGKGFTEWTNVGKALPNYDNHYQPHCPIHLGYYDLRVKEVMEEQATLAKQYGVHGFSYYFYWFDSKILMDRPLEDMLKNPDVDMPFCLTWANENWTRRWDGQENDILIGQNHSDSDSLAFIRHLDKYFKDQRYIKIDGKPVLIIYRASIIPNIKATTALWRKEAKKLGHPGLYLISAQSFGIRSPDEFNFDASVEFPPHTVSSTDIRSTLDNLNPNFNGHVFSYEQVVEHAISQPEPDYKLFRTAMLSWDNTARKQLNSHIFHGFSLLRYKQWLSKIANNVFNNKKYSSEEKIVFVNAWNEWAEGTHLEPDRRFGYGYLQSTYDVLKDYDQLANQLAKQAPASKTNPNAVILHLHYIDVWPELSTYIKNLGQESFDLYVSVTSKALADAVLSDYPDAVVRLYENRGRDILPFIQMLKEIDTLNYTCVCKIHSKKSIYRQDGAEIRGEILDSLIGDPEKVEAIVRRFKEDPLIGIISAKKYLIPHTDHNMTYCHGVVESLCNDLQIDFSYQNFPAGSMFWFRPAAIRQLAMLKPEKFALESGFADGTLPHAVERIFCVLAEKNQFKIETI